MKTKIPIIIVVLALIGLFSAAFVVDETEQVVVTQFGRVVGEPVTDPGLNFKIPFIQEANYFPKNLLDWDGESGQIPTLGKTFIYVDTFARWRITDPLLFFQTVSNITGALGRLDDIIDSAVRNLITSYPLIETVRMTDRELDTFQMQGEELQDERKLSGVQAGRQMITRTIQAQARPKLEEFGIELVDVKIKRLNYIEEVRRAVYQRMIAERKQMAEKFRSEGQGEAREIEGDAEKELNRIESEAYRTAQEIKGKADAEAAAVYTDAYGRDPEFYSFMRSLEIYRETMDEKSTLVLSTDSEFLRYLKDYEVKKPEERDTEPAAPFAMDR
ncbi:MAG: protease modulator HflC [Thermodesulfobacteriota bacterium]